MPSPGHWNKCRGGRGSRPPRRKVTAKTGNRPDPFKDPAGFAWELPWEEGAQTAFASSPARAFAGTKLVS
ncbi:hypothetical protein GCM10007285_03110 [Stappia taiwanensis]|nr:hypothetical protein GCM10007285_03110 [Stappia taiwanensis]